MRLPEFVKKDPLNLLPGKVKYRLYIERGYYRHYLPEISNGFYKLEKDDISIPYSEETIRAFDESAVQKIQFLQFHTPFEDAKFITSSSTDEGFSSSILKRITEAFTFGYLHNRTVIFDETSSPYEFCFETPICSHSKSMISDITLPDQQKRFLFSSSVQKVVAMPVSDYLRFILRRGMNRGRAISFTYPLRRIPDSFFYFTGLIMDSVLKLKDEYELHIRERRKYLNMESYKPIIGVHIRQGDVMTESYLAFRRFKLSDYMATIEEVVSKTGVKNVFIATDSPETIKQLPKDSGITFIYDDEEKRHDTSNSLMLLNNPDMKKIETMTAVKNIYLLSDCDYIVGSYGTSFIKFASALSYFRKKRRNLILITRSSNLYIIDEEPLRNNARHFKILGQW